MSYKDLCNALPSQSSVEFVQYFKGDQLASCSWDEFAEVAQDVVGTLALGIKVVAAGWWVQYYSCEWQVHWIPAEDIRSTIPEVKDLTSD